MTQNASVRVQLGPENVWGIENHFVKCQVRLENGRLRWTLSGKSDTPRVSIGPSAMPDLDIDHQAMSWQDKVTAYDVDREEGARALCIELLDPAANLRFTRYFEVFPNQPLVRMWGTVENTGATSVRVTDSQILNMDLPSEKPLTLFHVEQFSWVYRRDFFSQNQVPLHTGTVPAEVRMGSFPSRFYGPTSCAWAALREGLPDGADGIPRQDNGLILGIEFNGKSRLRAWAEENLIHLTSTVDDLNHRVDPGGTYEVPACFVGLFRGDWDEAGYVTQRFAEAHVHPPMPDERYPWVQYNTWGYNQDIHEAQQMEAIARCARMGVEVVVLDLGWAAEIGNWRADPVKFPRGLAPLADRCHEQGIKFGVHIPLAQANVSSPIAMQHPDWLTHTSVDYFGAAPICLGNDPCREWLINEIVRLIDDYHLDYIVHDGEDMVKFCTKKTHTHEPGDSNYSNSTKGLDVVIETLRELRPHVVWENCEDGGCMLTYKMARNYHSTITVDNIATYATRQGVYGASFPFSPRYSVRYMQDDPTTYTLRSAIFGGPLILMQQITQWTDEQMAQTQAAIADYKELRALVRDAKIIHLLAPLYNVEKIGWGWDAIQAVSADRTRGVVMVYRAMGDTPTKVIRPRGLDPDAIYHVRMTDRGDTLQVSGEALARDGVEVMLDELSSEIVRLQLVS